MERKKPSPTVGNLVAVENVERVLHGEDLDGAEGGVDVRVVVRMRSKAACSRAHPSVNALISQSRNEPGEPVWGE